MIEYILVIPLISNIQTMVDIKENNGLKNVMTGCNSEFYKNLEK